MKSRLVAAWILATTIAVLLAYQAVGLVQNQVTDRAPVLQAVEQSTTTLGVDDLPTVPPPVTVPEEAEDRVDSPPASAVIADDTETPTTIEVTPNTDSTSVTNPTVTTTTTSPPPSSTTSTLVAEPTQFTFSLEGGWVTGSCDGDEVLFGTAVPNSGFSYEDESDLPDKMKVVFEDKNDDHESSIIVVCEDGQPVEDIREQHDD